MPRLRAWGRGAPLPRRRGPGARSSRTPRAAAAKASRVPGQRSGTCFVRTGIPRVCNLLVMSLGGRNQGRVRSVRRAYSARKPCLEGRAGPVTRSSWSVKSRTRASPTCRSASFCRRRGPPACPPPCVFISSRAASRAPVLGTSRASQGQTLRQQKRPVGGDVPGPSSSSEPPPGASPSQRPGADDGA